MGKLQELIADVVKTGPHNVKRLMDFAEKLPSDRTLQQFNVTLNNLIPHIDQLERIIGDGNIKNLDRLVKKVPDQKTLDRLVKALSSLEKLPDQKTLKELLDKADNFQSFINSLEGGPDK